MKVVKNKIEGNKDNLDSIELIKDNKHLKMSLARFDELTVSFSYDNNELSIYQESFDIDKNDKEVYDAVNGLFLSFGGNVFFDTYGSNLMLINEESKYKFLFMKDLDLTGNEIRCNFFDESVENDAMKNLFLRLQNLEETKEDNIEKPKTLSKSLNKIVENK